MKILSIGSMLVTALALGCGSVSPAEDVDASVTPAPDAMVVPDAMPPDPCTLDEIPNESFGECYLRAVCSYLVDCTTSVDDTDECVAALQRDTFAVQIRIFQDPIDAGKVDVDGVAAKACLDGFGQCITNGGGCNRMFDGQTPQNGDCVNDVECGLGGDCVIPPPTDQCKVGACEIPRREGQSCEGGLRCESGLSCVGPVGSLVCSAGNVGDFCTSGFQCSDANRCNEGAMVCEPRVNENAACTINSDCSEPLDCIETTCQRPDSIGDACNFNCEAGLVCRAMVCVAAPLVGEACPESRCANDFFNQCSAGVCLARGKVGDSCAAVNCEFGLYCDPGASLCQERTANGQTCTADTECSQFNCNDANICEDFETCY